MLVLEEELEDYWTELEAGLDLEMQEVSPVVVAGKSVVRYRAEFPVFVKTRIQSDPLEYVQDSLQGGGWAQCFVVCIVPKMEHDALV